MLNTQTLQWKQRLIDAGKSEVRSKAPILESEAIPLQPITRYGVRANVDSTADYEFVETPIHMKKNPVYMYVTTVTVDSTADYEIVDTPIHKKYPVDVSTTVDSTADYEIVETPIHKKNPVDVSTEETPTHINWKQNPVYDATTQRQLQHNVVHRALNDEQTSQVENEWLGTLESPQQFDDYVQIIMNWLYKHRGS